MADLFLAPGDNSNLGVPVPFLQGSYWSGIDRIDTMLDGFGEQMPLGGGSSLNRLSAYGLPAEGDEAPLVDTLLSQLSGMGQSSITYNFEGLVGPQGGPGPAGPAGMPLIVDSSAGSGSLVKDFGKPIVSSSIVWSDDTPGAGSIAWTAGTVTLGTTVSQVVAGNTALEFVYWDASDPLLFQESADRADVIGATKWFIARNDGGTALPIYEGSKLFDGKMLWDATVEADAIASAAVTAAKTSLAAIDNSTGAISALHVIEGMVADNAITNGKIINDAITEGKVLNDAITAAKIAVAGLDGTTGNVATNHIAESMIIADAITATKIAVSGLDGTSGDVAANHITAGMIQTDAITAIKILADAVTATKINVIGLDGATGQINVSDATQANVLTEGINANATTNIAPGKVLISGGVNLDDWSHGSDATMIDGGDVYAHSVIASKLTILAHLLTGGTWGDNDPAGQVSWTDFSVEYNGVTYAITNGASANKYIWWDLTSPTVFQASATKPTLTDDDCMCALNIGGTHTVTWNATYIHGGVIQASTVNTEELAADAVTATKIDVVGLDGDAGTIIVTNEESADSVIAGINTLASTLITAGKIVISGATNLDDWQNGVDATKIEGGQIQTDTILTDSIGANQITATEIAGGTITVNEMGANSVDVNQITALAVETGKLAAGAVTAGKIAALTITAGLIQADAIETDKINGLAVNTGKIADDSTGLYNSATTSGYKTITSGAWEEVEDVTYTSQAFPVNLVGVASFQVTTGSGTATVGLRIVNGSDTLAEVFGSFSYTSSSDRLRLTVSAIDFPSSGSITYDLDAYISVANGRAGNRSIVAQEFFGK